MKHFIEFSSKVRERAAQYHYSKNKTKGIIYHCIWVHELSKINKICKIQHL